MASHRHTSMVSSPWRDRGVPYRRRFFFFSHGNLPLATYVFVHFHGFEILISPNLVKKPSEATLTGTPTSSAGPPETPWWLSGVCGKSARFSSNITPQLAYHRFRTQISSSPDANVTVRSVTWHCSILVRSHRSHCSCGGGMYMDTDTSVCR